MCTAFLVHLALLSDSLSKTVDAGQLITWLSWLAWSVRADLFCSGKLDKCWFLVNGLLLPLPPSCVLLISYQTFSQSHLSHHLFALNYQQIQKRELDFRFCFVCEQDAAMLPELSKLFSFFLPRHITTMARIWRGTEPASSDKSLWQRSKRQDEQSLVVLAVIFCIVVSTNIKNV